MPFINVKSSTINLRRNVLGKQGAVNASIVSATGTTETVNVFELIISKTAAETLVMGQPVSIIGGLVYVASNLKADNKPCHGIVIDDGNTNDPVRVQIGGIVTANLTLTSGMDVYLRNTGLSQTPLYAANVNEDGFQKIGTAIETNTMELNIQEFTQLT